MVFFSSILIIYSILKFSIILFPDYHPLILTNLVELMQ